MSGFDLDELEVVLTGLDVEDPPLVGKFDVGRRDEGLDWPTTALTMIGRQRLHNYRTLVEAAIDQEVPGDLVEAGVWRGGASIMARAVLAARGVADRKVVVADSFEGLPPPSDDYPADEGLHFEVIDELAVSLQQVQANFARFGLLDDQVVFLKGWFRDTMPLVESREIAVLRLDGDLYESTIDPLRHLYDRVSPGGWVIVDDYSILECCQRAVNDFFTDRGEQPTIVPIDRVGVYFRKPR